MRSARPSLDLVATLGLAVLALIVALVPVEGWLRVALLISLVFVLPGYAVVSALLPSGTIPATERAVYTLALSIVVLVLSGVIVQLVRGVDRATWVILLPLITVAATGVALRRRRALPWEPPRRVVPLIPPISALALVIAVALAGWAISIASTGARSDRVAARFTELWVLPAQVAPTGGKAVSVGVENHQGAPVSYRIRMTQRGIEIAGRDIRLRDGDRWRGQFPVRRISRAAPLLVTLLRRGAVYRRVYLTSGFRS
jgi:uncharacterized membrane protein